MRIPIKGELLTTASGRAYSVTAVYPDEDGGDGYSVDFIAGTNPDDFDALEFNHLKSEFEQFCQLNGITLR